MKLKKFLSTITALALIVSSLSLSSFAADKEPTPNVQFVPTGEDILVLKNVTGDLVAFFNNTNLGRLDADSNYNFDSAQNTARIPAVSPNTEIKIIKPGTPPTTEDSDPAVFIAAQEESPDIQPNQKVAPQSASNDDGKITGLDNTYEYRLGSDTSAAWTQIPTGQTEITGLRGGTEYHIRKKASATKFASSATAVTLDNYQAPLTNAADPTEVKVFGKTNNVFELRNVASDIFFSVEGREGPFGRGNTAQTEWQSTVDNIIDGGIYIYRAGVPGTSSNSNKILLPLVRPDAPVAKSQNNPSGIEAHRPTSDANNDGKITGIPAGIEYMRVGLAHGGTNEVYVDVSGDTLEGLAPGSYYFRYKGAEGKLASNSTVVDVPYYATPEDTPNTSFVATGYDKGTLSGLSNGLKYSVDGGNNYTDIPNGRTSIDITNITPTNDVRVVKKATSSTTKLDSAPQVIEFKEQLILQV